MYSKEILAADNSSLSKTFRTLCLDMESGTQHFIESEVYC